MTTQTEALKLALEALEPDVYRAEWAVEQDREKAITAIKEALAQPTSGDYAHGYVEGFNDACMPKPAQQEPVAWVTKRNVIVDGLWEEEITFSEFDDGGDPVYYTPPQPEERNFCPRCGKRTADLTVIHTCTPPQPEQEPVAWKLMPRDATDSMLKAMDECSTEGYDERLYAGHAASVYMAAWDEAPTPPQENT